MIWGLGFYIFDPDRKDAEFDNHEEYAYHVLIKQVSIFGPVPASYLELFTKDDERLGLLGEIITYIQEKNKAKPFLIIKDKELTEGDRTFLLKIMKLDPRDRPTAKQLLQDSWFHEL